MEVTVKSAQGFPEKAYLSLRAGETRKQVQYKPGECFKFDCKNLPRHLVVDVFEKVSCAQVTLADLCAAKEGGTVQLLGRDGSPIVLDMSVKLRTTQPVPEAKKPRVSRHQAAMEAQCYLEAHSVQKVLQGMVHELLAKQPADPLPFMATYIQEHTSPDKMGNPVPAAVVQPHNHEESDDEDDDSPDWAMRDGMGELEFPGFASDASMQLPDLSKYHNIMASVLREDLSIYERLKDVRTSAGVTLAQCIKPGVDNKGHPMIRTLGLVAGDGQCYDTFSDVFLPVKKRWHSSNLKDCVLDANFNGEKEAAMLLGTGAAEHLLSAQVTCSRNLCGLRMPSAAAREEFHEAERILADALLNMQDELLTGGDYHPLRSSSSYAPKPRGMTRQMEAEFKARGQLLAEPSNGLQLSSGYGRHWPQGRGIFAAPGSSLVAWVNEADHLRLSCSVSGFELWDAFQNMMRIERMIGSHLEAQGQRFASSESLGFLTSDPTNVGAGVQASAVLCLPSLSSDPERLKELCRSFGLNPSRKSRTGAQKSQDSSQCHVWEVFVARSHLMKAEAIVGSLARGCRKLVELEMELKSGADIAELGPPGTATTAPGTVSSPDVMEEFPRDRCPAQMPDVSSRHSLAADVLKSDSFIYQQVKDRCTSKGVPFATCIKACFDNVGHPFLKTVGAVAGDADSYSVFKEFFDPLIRLGHPGNSLNCSHVSCSDWTQLCRDPIDPSGRRVLRAQVKAARNFQELRFLPACSLDERRAVESAAVQSLLAMSQDFKGDYFPLYGSESYQLKHGGMTEADEARLREAGLAFDEPDSSVLIASGLAQDWPDARGIFVDDCSKLSVVINELDHLSFCYTEQEGQSNIQLAFEHLCKVLHMFEESLAAAGWHFAKDEKLGYLGTCPSMLGTCLTASVTIRIPLLSRQPRFRELCKRLDLEASLSAGFQEGVWEVRNSTRLGSSDVSQVNAVINACRNLLALEALLEDGENLDLDSTALQNGR
eukprot:TRINITY_DN1508_c0_g2_i1.p1 TRINITY_DN1508_c0_g2~~TRINITY_DN1508_c0_g2_i1.p1  ORF type:complete len:994 (+),score=202.01 TRINITY_DN1508_c0_g2_i1:64-3045(+)